MSILQIFCKYIFYIFIFTFFSSVNLSKPDSTIVTFIHYMSWMNVDERDLKWVANEKNVLLSFKQF